MIVPLVMETRASSVILASTQEARLCRNFMPKASEARRGSVMITLSFAGDMRSDTRFARGEVRMASGITLLPSVTLIFSMFHERTLLTLPVAFFNRVALFVFLLSFGDPQQDLGDAAIVEVHFEWHEGQPLDLY